MLNFIYGKSLSPVHPGKNATMIYTTESKFIEAYNHYKPIVKKFSNDKDQCLLVIDRCSRSNPNNPTNPPSYTHSILLYLSLFLIINIISTTRRDIKIAEIVALA
jgi:hypothetical protein